MVHFHRAIFLLAFLCLMQGGASAQTYTFKARYDSLDTRHDPSRPLLERYWTTSNHHWACFNRGLGAEARMAAKEELELARQLGVDSL
ncbi:MAG TPA: hypothetical protein PK760_11660, partial [Flavobacteriales bacterium]|nr:hypothetical protein [Flavobacteriales bacterium]